MRLLQRLNGVASTRDTPRGLVVTFPDSSFDGGSLRADVASNLARIASAVAQPGMRVSVEGYTDNAAGFAVSEARAEAIRDSLVRNGLSPGAAMLRNYGAERPLTSNATPAGRIQNRRVEVVISGDLIGSMPLWDRSYDVTLR